MAARQHFSRRLMAAALTTAVVAAALTPAAVGALSPPPVTVASGPDCVNGVIPLNPEVVNCNLPPRKKRVIGAAPDAGAIIACRHVPICLSYYVNYPGTLLVPGYRP